MEASQPDSLYLAECNLVLCPIVKLGGPRRLMAGHLLGIEIPYRDETIKGFVN